MFLSKPIVYKIEDTIFNSKDGLGSISFFVCVFCLLQHNMYCVFAIYFLSHTTTLYFSCTFIRCSYGYLVFLFTKIWFFTCIIKTLVLEQTKKNTDTMSTPIPISLWLERLRNWYGAGRIRFLFVYLSIIKYIYYVILQILQ